MLIEFSVKNFLSIRDRQTLSMVASAKDKEPPENTIETELPGLKGVRLLKSVAIYGANASGKSNLLEALRFIDMFVGTSAMKLEPDDEIEIR